MVLTLGICVDDVFTCLYLFSTRARYTFWRNCELIVVSEVAMTYFVLYKAAKDFSLVAQGFKVEGRLKRWRNIVCKAISSVLRLISPFPFLFGKHVFTYLMACWCQMQFTLGWKSAEWTQRWVDLWNDLGFSLCAAPSVCHVVTASDEGGKVWVGVSTNWCVTVEHWRLSSMRVYLCQLSD